MSSKQGNFSCSEPLRVWGQKEMPAAMKLHQGGEALQFKTNTIVASFPEDPELKTDSHFWSLRGGR